jgi:putative transposase
MVDKKSKELSVNEQCQLLELHRSGVYYKPKNESEKDLEIMAEIDKLHIKDPTLGTRRMKIMLRLKGYKIGRTHVRTLMKKMRIKVIYCRPRTTINDPTKYKYPYLLGNLNIVRPNQAWAIDITYIPMSKGFMYMTAIIDLYSRFVLSWSISNTMDAVWVTDIVKEAVRTYGKPEIINSDQGSQFTSDEYVGYIKSLKTTKISMDGKGRAVDNIFIERFWRTIKYEKIYIQPPENGLELFKMCEEFINYYNFERPHQSADYQTPKKMYYEAA